MKVTFEPAARDELDAIFAWIAKDSPRAAVETITRIEEKVMRLATPGLMQMGRHALSPQWCAGNAQDYHSADVGSRSRKSAWR